VESLEKKTILIVDDTAQNIAIISNILNAYDVIAATNGYDALEIAANETLDLILLDIMMPQMDGFETCKRLKALPNSAGVPLIFITAKTMVEDITHGFELGAVDYITKPFNPAELLARVHTHLELDSYKKELEYRVAKEVEKNKLKQQLLFQQSKQAAIGELLMHIAHQWKQPLSELSILNAHLISKTDLGVEVAPNEIASSCKKSDSIIRFMTQTMHTFQNFYKPTHKTENFSVYNAVMQASQIVKATYDYLKISLHIEQKADPIRYGNQNEYAQVILNLLNNAKDIFIQNNTKNPSVRVTIAQNENTSVVTVCDNGGGFSTSNLKGAYKLGVSGTNSSGMGLYMSKAIMEKNGGKIEIANENNGAKIEVFL
jgi:DNA-binding response OmpR family regulator